MPHGATFKLVGLTGSIPDNLAGARYHDEAMSRTMQGQVAQLGQTENGSGSYALSTSLFDLLDSARDMVADWVATNLTEQAVARWCVNNGVELDRMPFVGADRPEPEPADLQPSDFVALAGARLIDPEDAAVRREVARRFGLPAPTSLPDVVVPPVGDDPAALAGGRRHLHAAPAGGEDSGVPGTRALNAYETRARVLFATIDEQWQAASASLGDTYRAIRDAIIAATVAQVELGVDLDRPDALASTLRSVAFAAIPADRVDEAVDALTEAATLAAQQVADEFGRQGATVTAAAVDYGARARSEAQMVAEQLAVSVGIQVTARIAQYAGEGTTPADVAAAIRADLEALSTAATDDLARAGTSRAQHAGRTATMREQEQDVTGWYASELLDSSTCGPCSLIDGREFDSLDDALVEYPTGGYRACEGGPRCRGTLVAIHRSEQEVSVA
jgi:hypothetical protein